MKQIVRCLVVDLDNTLFDWVDIWYKSFSAMLKALVEDTGIPQETLELEFKGVHQRHGTSEYAFSLEELLSLEPFVADGTPITTRFEGAIKQYRIARAEALKLYPGVREALQAVKAKGCLLVGYTESMQFYTSHRVRRLDLDVLLDYIYSPHDHALPFGMTREQVRRYPSESYRYRHTLQRYTPPGELKPNPEVLKDILRDVGADPETTIYVGDSLLKDVSMALGAGVTGVWAKYGVAQARDEYELLRRVTHWTDKMVELEKTLKSEDVEPSNVLQENLLELLDVFDFQSFKQDNTELSTLQVEIWKKAIDVQQHFNDIELKIRNFAITLAVGVVGALAVTLKDHLVLQMFGVTMSVGVLVLVVGIFGTAAFWFMDRLWYHRLLVGAVKHAASLETHLIGMGVIPRLSQDQPTLGLTQSIGKESPFKIFGKAVHSKNRLDLFYAFLVIALALASIVVAIGTPTRERNVPQEPQAQSATIPVPLPQVMSGSTPRQGVNPNAPRANPTPKP
jgi:phosphoglycolate phosphatase-like HAD superfamily hydrolase